MSSSEEKLEEVEAEATREEALDEGIPSDETLVGDDKEPVGDESDVEFDKTNRFT
jgi:hypothetical protein